jgi:UDP-glucose 4-epimerase
MNMISECTKNNLKEILGKSVLVTGGTGFIGSHLVDALKDFCSVIILSRRRNIEGLKTINADLRDENDICKKIGNLDIDIVFHLAGNVKSPGKETAEEYFEINARGTKNLLEACRKNDIEKIIYSSSMSVFGNPLYLPVDEKHPKIPNTFYGMSKFLGEIYCMEYRDFYDLNTIILRYSDVFGPRQPPVWVTSIFINNALNNKPLHIYGSGKSSVDFVYVKDIVTANINAASKKEAIGEDFNIGSGSGITIEELAKTIKKIMNDVKITYDPKEKNNDEKKFLFDISKAKKMLGYKPNYTIENGLFEQMDYISRRNAQLEQN